jgi:hypothetical protein
MGGLPKDIEDEEKARNLEEARAIIREKQERARMDE